MSRLLLDTHAFLWAVGADPRLSPRARRAFLESTNELCLSVASVWEMAIKTGLGKLQVPEPLHDFIEEQLRVNNIRLLHISLRHATTVSTLPFHHRDPFDRLLVAQARCESISIVSADQALDAYGVERLW